MEDFRKTYPIISNEELNRFIELYELTLKGTFNDIPEFEYFQDNNHILDTEELDTRLFRLRDRARAYFKRNSNPNAEKIMGPENIRELDERIQILDNKRITGSITEDELWELKSL
jgi:hypothetical protein